MATAASLEALDKLRELNQEQGWYVIPLLVLVLYIYGVEIKNARNRELEYNFCRINSTWFGSDK